MPVYTGAMVSELPPGQSLRPLGGATEMILRDDAGNVILFAEMAH